MDKHIKELKILLGFFLLYPWLGIGYLMIYLKMDGVPFYEQLQNGFSNTVLNSMVGSATILISFIGTFFLSKSKGKVQYMYALPCLVMFYLQINSWNDLLQLPKEFKYMHYARVFFITSWAYITAKYFWVVYVLTKPHIEQSR